MKYQTSWGNQEYQGYWLDSSFYENICDRLRRRVRHRLLYVSNHGRGSQEFVESDYSKA
ncbi:hypothetical protein LC607_32380 [Nostoc sp. CHAB 5824]|nr:hypothetical protein [Nostoc sp. CHAB 5824]